ncbi:deadhead 2b [Drosophila willistoni]|uniref:Thioredoxin n=1 Tax=Drosophila willistoni TaxID=7260 RepID=B4MHS5_DROWI|nr:thioredoxin-1 [Drosophila willistoni]EDW71664.1 deadhead 2a [Drosophila willistoni]EDW71954.1 deadhead 2b [Drosophila willistoni]
MTATATRSLNDFHKRLEAADRKLVVLDFYATWCGICKEMEGTVKSLARQYAGKAVFIKINVDKFEELTEKYNVRSMPTFVFLKGMRRVSSFSGADDDKLIRTVTKLAK